MGDAITDVQGIEVGHAQDLAALTGCSVVLSREGAVVGVDVRGSAPGTRETDLARPGTLVTRAQAILLTGGSAFGLDAATGVVRYLHERGLGFDTGIARVPIVPGAVIFDLGLGKNAWPDAAMGYQACVQASSRVEQGSVGAGTGASVGKLLGIEHATKSGVGTASVRIGAVTVGALVVVNAFGDVVMPGTGTVIAGARDPVTGTYIDTVETVLSGLQQNVPPINTTIGVVATDAALNVEQVSYLARVAHNGLARTIRPVHTMADGDTIFTLATGHVAWDWTDALLRLTVAAVHVVEQAVVRAVTLARPLGGLPAGGPESD